MIVSKPTHLAKPFYLLKHVRLARGRCECLFVHITCLPVHSGDGFVPMTSLRVHSGDGFVPMTSLRVHSGDGFVPMTSLRVHSDDWLSYNVSTCSHRRWICPCNFSTFSHRWRACPYNLCSHRHWATPGRLLGCHLKEPCPPGSSSVSTSTTHGHWWRWVPVSYTHLRAHETA